MHSHLPHALPAQVDRYRVLERTVSDGSTALGCVPYLTRLTDRNDAFVPHLTPSLLSSTYSYGRTKLRPKNSVLIFFTTRAGRPRSVAVSGPLQAVPHGRPSALLRSTASTHVSARAVAARPPVLYMANIPSQGEQASSSRVLARSDLRFIPLAVPHAPLSQQTNLMLLRPPREAGC